MAFCCCRIASRIHAGEAWRRFLADPGDVVIGATQAAGCYGATAQARRRSGTQAHLMKLAFEKYFVWKARHGYAQQP